MIDRISARNAPTHLNRITIFCLDDCERSKETLCAFTSRNIPHKEVNLTAYPEHRNAMHALSDGVSSMPQVFFDGEFVGGAEETLDLLEKWDGEYAPNPLDRYRQNKIMFDDDEFADAECSLVPEEPYRKERMKSLPSESSIRLTKLPKAPRSQSASAAFPEVTDLNPDRTVRLPTGERVTVLEITKTLMDIMPRSDLTYMAKTYKNCFRGRDGVAALAKHFYGPSWNCGKYNYDDMQAIIDFGWRLQRVKILHHVTNDHAFGENDYFFRLQPFQRPKVLNSYRKWFRRVDPDCIGLLKRLTTMMAQILSAATDNAGLVDYIAASQNPDYTTFEEASCELQGVRIHTMDMATRKAFSVNLYNLMVRHAFVKLGIPSTCSARATFYGNVSYNVGGEILSIDMVEHGILRSNARRPYHRGATFSSGDHRHRHLSMDNLDPRIHFALNCDGGISPPVVNLTAEGIDDELDVLAQAFCELEDNLSLDEKKNEITLSMIFSWYRGDFTNSNKCKKLLLMIMHYLQGSRKEQMRRMIESSSSGPSVKFKRFDWSPMVKAAKAFECGCLESTVVGVPRLRVPF